MQTILTKKQAIAHAFGRAAKNYDNIALFQQQSGQYLFNCLSSIPSNIILDVGCGTGYFSDQWRLTGKQVIALDLSAAMLAIAQQKKVAKIYIQADMEYLPIADESIDLCFSHLAIQWCSNLYTPLSELYRITKKGGVIGFSTLIDGSLKELQQCWKKIDNNKHINSFMTFQQIKQTCHSWKYSLKKQSWLLTYPSFICLLRSIKGVGATYLINGRQQQGLMTKNQLEKLIDYYPHSNKQFPLTYNLVYGMLYRE
ncbi:Malonyl-[acyl-carrier protein] O-methyltransferase [Candidatus Arsenophonus lipoptenae]|uniref:Malonyl-[acyl-carrier protein] O-methyltransferase n=1 Tax=Candidatus Arsenophonus lipoptenae TaxID=634113 RepID=A0A0X8CXT6_9GAMM|nr:malonyl-ACP O-methyltransferase BioC [Candidatus Arsenophonus lipoptenae]AMA64857.1 Malonyl-[acyl-carrier protein] O-methyltransferase [Candidatus Arsenophonus lipoptenae]